ncbi:MAG: TetR/AcrR family transcriptional regulator [Nitrospinota bacterium]|nr:TetR/AcrR family transcriptional regulator [Nitrospinota bacterium]
MPKVDKEYLEQKGAHILKAAKACFSQNGFHKTTMRDILKKSKLSAGAVYSYFKSKDDIIEAIAIQDLGNRSFIIDNISTTADSKERLVGLARGFFDMLKKEEKPFIGLELESWAEAGRNPRIMEVQRKALLTIKKQFKEMIEEGQRKGEMHPDVDPESLSTLLIALRRGLMAQLAVDRNIDIDKYTETVMHTLFKGLLTDKKGAR